MSLMPIPAGDPVGPVGAPRSRALRPGRAFSVLRRDEALRPPGPWKAGWARREEADFAALNPDFACYAPPLIVGDDVLGTLRAQIDRQEAHRLRPGVGAEVRDRHPLHERLPLAARAPAVRAVVHGQFPLQDISEQGHAMFVNDRPLPRRQRHDRRGDVRRTKLQAEVDRGRKVTTIELTLSSERAQQRDPGFSQ